MKKYNSINEWIKTEFGQENETFDTGDIYKERDTSIMQREKEMWDYLGFNRDDPISVGDDPQAMINPWTEDESTKTGICVLMGDEWGAIYRDGVLIAEWATSCRGHIWGFDVWDRIKNESK